MSDDNKSKETKEEPVKVKSQMALELERLLKESKLKLTK